MKSLIRKKEKKEEKKEKLALRDFLRRTHASTSIAYDKQVGWSY